MTGTSRGARLMELTCLGLVVVMAPSVCARQAPTQAWQDPSRHQIRFVNVDQGVTLEVLDWGGSGRPILLPGPGIVPRCCWGRDRGPDR